MPKRILCIDDDTELCYLVSRLLENYECISAHTKAEALLKARKERVDLILLDYQLPDGLGLEVCQLIRAFNQVTPIVFCTASIMLSREQITSAGAQCLLIKGLDFIENLEPTVNKLLYGEKAHQQAIA